MHRTWRDRWRRGHALLATCLALASGSVAAETIRIEVDGVDRAIADNIRGFLTLGRYAERTDVTDSQVRRLADRAPAADDPGPATDLPADLERALSAPFVRHARYGTRCSTLAFVEHDGRTRVHERRFDAAGAQTGSSRFEFRGGSQ